MQVQVRQSLLGVEPSRTQEGGGQGGQSGDAAQQTAPGHADSTAHLARLLLTLGLGHPLHFFEILRSNSSRTYPHYPTGSNWSAHSRT